MNNFKEDNRASIPSPGHPVDTSLEVTEKNRDYGFRIQGPDLLLCIYLN